MYRRYYSVNDMPQMIRNDSEHIPQREQENIKSVPEVHKNVEEELGIIQDGKLFGKFEIDDVILIAVIIILLVDDCDDMLLLLALGFVFFTGLA
ncbi:MAG: hypothetical protein SOZ34_10415 [Clostridia bacterium]|nr:hypothetical protein [Clostridia bacterium]